MHETHRFTRLLNSLVLCHTDLGAFDDGNVGVTIVDFQNGSWRDCHLHDGFPLNHLTERKDHRNDTFPFVRSTA